MSKKSKTTKEFIRKEPLLKNLPYLLFAKEGTHILPLAKGGEEGFYNRCLHTYRISTIQLQVFASRTPTDGGFSLIELLIALVISMVIIGAIYGSYISQQRSYIAQDQVSEMNSTSKIALDMIVNDIRETGFGLPENLSLIQRTSGCTGINGFIQKIISTDSSSAEDSITLIGGFRRIGNIAAEFSAGSTTLTLTATDLLKDGGTFQPDRGYISIGGVSFAIVTAISGNVLTLSSSTPVEKTFPVNVPVYLVENVTYEVALVDGVPVLQRVRRSDGSGTACGTSPETDVIAENIEDFQIAYGYDTNDDHVIEPNTEFFDAPPATDRLFRIRLNLLARTARPDPNFQGQGNPPAAIENRSHSSTNDSFRRRLWQMEVTLRNPLS